MKPATDLDFDSERAQSLATRFGDADRDGVAAGSDVVSGLLEAMPGSGVPIACGDAAAKVKQATAAMAADYQHLADSTLAAVTKFHSQDEISANRLSSLTEKG